MTHLLQLTLICASFVFVAPQCDSNLEQDVYPAFGPTIQQLTEPVLHGEGPTWDARTNRLYFVDIQNGMVFSYDPDSGDTYYITFNGTVSPFVQSRNEANRFYVGVNRSILRITWDGEHAAENVENLTTVALDQPTSRLNDGKADSRGRLWFGTMGFEDASGVAPNAGALYRIDAGAVATVMITPVNVSNGLAWNRADDAFFYIDTPTYEVVRYDYDSVAGTIANPTVVVNFRTLLGDDALPDGMTIDTEDNLWVALHGAGAVVHVNSTDGSIMRRIAMPAQYVTSCMWGGRDLDVLFVTTSRVQLDARRRLQQPATGSLFAVRGLGAKGLPVFGGDI